MYIFSALVHSAAHNLSSLVPPYLETVNVVLLHAYTDDMCVEEIKV